MKLLGFLMEGNFVDGVMLDWLMRYCLVGRTWLNIQAIEPKLFIHLSY
jgi:hypothetical protein